MTSDKLEPGAPTRVPHRPAVLRTLASSAGIALLAASLLRLVDAAAQDRVELTVEIVGIRHSAGTIAIAVFDDEQNFDNRLNAAAKARVAVEGDTARWKTTLDAADRPIAVMAYHDINDNGMIDLGRMGVPREPYGFSNDARGLFGPPHFEEASIPPRQSDRITIRLH